jgi:hypothetical protein
MVVLASNTEELPAEQEGQEIEARMRYWLLLILVVTIETRVTSIQ